IDQPRSGRPRRVRSGDAGRLPRDRQRTSCGAHPRLAGDLSHHLLPDAARRGDGAGAATRSAKPAPARAVVTVVRGIAAALLRRIDAGVRRRVAVSGATKALPDRMAILRSVLPLSVLEVSHLLASVIGM